MRVSHAVQVGPGRRTPAACLLVGAACVVFTACGSAAAPGAGHTGDPVGHRVAPATGVAHPSASMNKARTLTESHRLVDLTAVPARTTRLTSAPAALPGPAMGAARSSSTVDTSKFWHVPLTVAQSTAWIAAHPPRGLLVSGSSQSTTRSVVTSIGYDYTDDRTSHAWRNGMLEILVAPDGRGASVWRADGVAQWLDPTPTTAARGGRRFAVTVAGACPGSDRGAANVPPGSTTSLLPQGSPTAAVICSYEGLNGAAFQLRSSARLTAGQAARLAAQARAIDLSHTIGDVVVCPNDAETATVVAFAYPGGAHAALWLHDSGCQTISNGAVDAVDDPSVSAFSTAVSALLPL